MQNLSRKRLQCSNAVKYLLAGITIIGFVVSVMSGCSSSGEKNTTAQPGTHTIVIRQMKFVPDQLTVQPGDTVTWINEDYVSHTVAAKKDQEWESDEIKQGERFTLTVTDSARYTCTLHPVMEGTILTEQD